MAARGLILGAILVSVALLDPAGVVLRDKRISAGELREEFETAVEHFRTSDTPRGIQDAVGTAVRSFNRNLLSHSTMAESTQQVWLEYVDKWSFFILAGLFCVVTASKKLFEVIHPARVVTVGARVECGFFALLAFIVYSSGSTAFELLREGRADLFEMVQLCILMRSPVMVFALWKCLQKCVDQTDRGVYALSIFLHLASTFDYAVSIISPLAHGQSVTVDVMMPVRCMLASGMIVWWTMEVHEEPSEGSKKQVRWMDEEYAAMEEGYVQHSDDEDEYGYGEEDTYSDEYDGELYDDAEQEDYSSNEEGSYEDEEEEIPERKPAASQNKTVKKQPTRPSPNQPKVQQRPGMARGAPRTPSTNVKPKVGGNRPAVKPKDSRKGNDQDQLLREMEVWMESAASESESRASKAPSLRSGQGQVSSSARSPRQPVDLALLALSSRSAKNTPAVGQSTRRQLM